MMMMIVIEEEDDNDINKEEEEEDDDDDDGNKDYGVNTGWTLSSALSHAAVVDSPCFHSLSLVTAIIHSLCCLSVSLSLSYAHCYSS